MPSNLVATVIQDYISFYGGRLDRHEQRPSEYGAMNLFNAQTNSPVSILDEKVKQNIEASFSRSVKVPVINYKDVAIGSARTCAMKTDGITSALVDYQTAINKLIDAGLQKLAATIDAACVALLETNKNQYFPQAILDYYAEVGDALQVPQLEKDFFYNNLGSIMATMDYAGTPDIATNHIGMAMVRKIGAQGEGNSVNQGWQLLGYTWYPTNRITNGGAPIESTLYAVAPGSVALASRLDPDSKHRARIHESKYWDSFPNAPYIGRDLGVFYQADCADASALDAAAAAGLTRTKVESWEFSIDVFYVKPYVSDVANRYSPILKAEILA